MSRHRYQQTCWCYCPACRNELTVGPSTYESDGGIITYVCSACGTKSRWLFDAPVPLLLKETPHR